MECPGCGASVPEGRFCTGCGAPLPSRCPVCCAAHPHSAKFCPECGSRLSAGASAPPPAPAVASREAERRQLTVLFCDLVGSTELSARLDPEDMGEVIRAYQNAVAGEITRFEGHIAKYMGDGVLAYFGYPRAHEDEAERAVRTGLALVEAVGKLASPTGDPLAVRVGIATGLVVVGELIGEGASREQDVVGETPNLAARLQARAEPGTAVISQATGRLVGGRFELTDLGPQRLKGFAEPIRAWRVVGISAAESRFEASHATGLTPLVGRELQLELLLDRWVLAKNGEGQVVLLSGEPGIGKSRLTRALRERLAGEPHLRLLHQCSPYHETSPLHPVIEHIELAAELKHDDAVEMELGKLEALLARGTDRLHEAVPLIAALLGIPAGERYALPELTPQRQKQRTLEVLAEQLAGLATEQPLLVVWEDVHWIDPTSQELLGLIIDRVERLPVLLLVTFRPEFTPPWTGCAHVTSLNLGRLGQPQGAELVERLTGSKPLPAEVLEQILARTDGVPLFVEELTKTVLDSGLLRDVGSRYELSGPLPPLAIPSTLHDSLLARLDRLARVKEVAQIGAGIGREFSHALLAAVADRPEVELRAVLDELVGSELVFRRGTPPEATYSFKHALVRDAAYASLLKSRRRQLHGRIAEELLERFPSSAGTQPELVAYHYTEAALADQALVHWLKAGDLAIRRSAYAEAISHIETGLALVERLPEGPQRDQYELALQTALGPALMATKGWSAREVEQVYLRARELCEQIGDSAQLFRTMRGLFAFYLVRSELRTARVVAERLVALAEEASQPALVLEAHRASGQALCNIGEFRQAHAHLRQALDLYESEKYRSHAFQYGYDPGVTGLSNAAWASWYLGYPGRAGEAVTDAVALADQLGHAFSLAYALGYATWLHRFRRDAQQAQDYADRLIRLSREQGFEQWLAWGTILRASAPTKQGIQEDDLARMREGLAAHLATGAALWQSCFLGMLAEGCGKQGNTEEALCLLSEALATAEKNGEGFYLAELHRLEGDLLMSRPGANGSEAEPCFRRAVAIAREQGTKSLELRAATSLARLWADQGQRAEAYVLLAPVYGWFTEGFETADLVEAKALLDELTV